MCICTDRKDLVTNQLQEQYILQIYIQYETQNHLVHYICHTLLKSQWRLYIYITIHIVQGEVNKTFIAPFYLQVSIIQLMKKSFRF